MAVLRVGWVAIKGITAKRLCVYVRQRLNIHLMRSEVIPFTTAVSSAVFSEQIRWKVTVLQAVVRADFVCGDLGLFPGQWLRISFGQNGTGANHPHCIMPFSQ